MKSGDAVHPHATAETMLSALSALCQSSVAPRTPAASMQGEQEEIRRAPHACLARAPRKGACTALTLHVALYDPEHGGLAGDAAC